MKKSIKIFIIVFIIGILSLCTEKIIYSAVNNQAPIPHVEDRSGPGNLTSILKYVGQKMKETNVYYDDLSTKSYIFCCEHGAPSFGRLNTRVKVIYSISFEKTAGTISSEYEVQMHSKSYGTEWVYGGRGGSEEFTKDGVDNDGETMIMYNYDDDGACRRSKKDHNGGFKLTVKLDASKDGGGSGDPDEDEDGDGEISQGDTTNRYPGQHCSTPLIHGQDVTESSTPGVVEGSVEMTNDTRTTGDTHYDKVQDYSTAGKSYGTPGKNDAVAYIFAEAQNNATKPSASYVNCAFWALIKNAYDSSKWKSSKTSQTYGVPSGKAQTENGKKLLSEAMDFAEMWKVIESAEGKTFKYTDFYGEVHTLSLSGDYMTSVNDASPTPNTEDLDVIYMPNIERYKVGPFKIAYLERYTGRTQLCGMTGVPELTIRVNGADEVHKYGDQWEFWYDHDRREWWDNYIATVQPDSDIEVDVLQDAYDTYPHNEEEFYFLIDYIEGFELIHEYKTNYRWLEAETLFATYAGFVDELKWNAKAVVKSTCNSGHPCSLYNKSEDPEHDTSCNHGTTEHPNWCTAGVKCSHGYLFPHYLEIDIVANAEYTGESPIQDYADDQLGDRGYDGLLIGQVGPGDNEKIFTWDIDITTSLAGDVWFDEDRYQKDETEQDYINGKYERGKESGINNVAVTVYVYDEKEEFVREAIAYEKGTGNYSTFPKRVEWPIYTGDFGDKGWYEVYRLEAPGIGGKNAFYVLEFQYDGQVLRHAVYMGNETEQTSGDYEGSPNSYEDNSMANETVHDREYFDRTFGEITGDSQISGGTTNGFTPMTDIYGKDAPDSGDDVEYKDMENGSVVIESELISPMKDPKNAEKSVDTRYNLIASTFYDVKRAHIEEFGSEELCDTTHGQANLSGHEDERRIHYPVEYNQEEYVLNEHVADGNETRYIDTYMLHINLGLMNRIQSDISVLEDLYKVNVVVNEQQTYMEFNNLGHTGYVDVDRADGDYDDTFRILLEGGVYNLDLYASDIGFAAKARYREAIQKVQELKDKTELRVFATYVTRVYNKSATHDVEINVLSKYYDPTFTLIQNDCPISSDHGLKDDGIWVSIINENMTRQTKKVADTPYYRVLDSTTTLPWLPTRKENLESGEGVGSIRQQGDVYWKNDNTVQGYDMKYAETETFEAMKLHVNEYIEIFTTYEVDYEGYVTMTNESGDDESLSNREKLFKNDYANKYVVSEVKNYSTYYTAQDDRPGVEEPFATNLGAGCYDDLRWTYAQTVEWVSGRVERDSAPNNVPRQSKEQLLNRTDYEDDTYQANGFKIQLANTERDIGGYVFEDMKNTGTNYALGGEGTGNLARGDGIYNGEDKLIENVEVSMFEVINLDDKMEEGLSNWSNYEYYYEVPHQYYRYESGDEWYKGKGPQTTSKTGSEGNYKIKGFLAGDYVLRFDYGFLPQKGETEEIYRTNTNGSTVKSSEPIIKYNGQDYETTSYLSEAYGNQSESHINDKFLVLRQQDTSSCDNIISLIEKPSTAPYSVARDNESRRMVVDAFSRTLENDRAEILRDRIAPPEGKTNEFVEATRMFAETPIMQIEAVDPMKLEEDDKTDEDPDGYVVTKIIKRNMTHLNYMTLNYSIKNINCGLEERAKTDISLVKRVYRIFISKHDEILLSATLHDDGSIDLEADNQHLNKMPFITHTQMEDAGIYQQGFYNINIEDEFLDGLDISIEYKIEVKNESEVDFTGVLAQYYIASDIIKAASVSPTIDCFTSSQDAIIQAAEDGKLDDGPYGVSTNTTLWEILSLAKSGYDVFKNDPNDVILDLLQSGMVPDKEYHRDTIRPNVIVYGSYVGRFYYENYVDEQPAVYQLVDYDETTYTQKDYAYSADFVVKTTVDQLVDYIDVNANYYEDSFSQRGGWIAGGVLNRDLGRVSNEALKGLISQYAFRNTISDEGSEVGSTSSLYDEKENSLLTDVSSNVYLSEAKSLSEIQSLAKTSGAHADLQYLEKVWSNDANVAESKGRVEYNKKRPYYKNNTNAQLIRELVPASYNSSTGQYTIGRVWIEIARMTTSSSETKDLRFDNLAEVLVYSNPTGRRDINSVPGNAMTIVGKYKLNDSDITAGFWYAGYNSIEYWRANGYFGEKETAWTNIPENDQFSPEYITITPPTGIALRKYMNTVVLPITVLTTALIIMVGLFGYKQIRIHKAQDKKDDKQKIKK